MSLAYLTFPNDLTIYCETLNATNLNVENENIENLTVTNLNATTLNSTTINNSGTITSSVGDFTTLSVSAVSHLTTLDVSAGANFAEGITVAGGIDTDTLLATAGIVSNTSLTVGTTATITGQSYQRGCNLQHRGILNPPGGDFTSLLTPAMVINNLIITTNQAISECTATWPSASSVLALLPNAQVGDVFEVQLVGFVNGEIIKLINSTDGSFTNANGNPYATEQYTYITVFCLITSITPGSQSISAIAGTI